MAKHVPGPQAAPGRPTIAALAAELLAVQREHSRLDEMFIASTTRDAAANAHHEAMDHLTDRATALRRAILSQKATTAAEAIAQLSQLAIEADIFTSSEQTAADDGRLVRALNRVVYSVAGVLAPEAEGSIKELVESDLSPARDPFLRLEDRQRTGVADQ